MAKCFNTTAVCVPEKHYMVDISGRLREIKKLIDEGKYFMINRARQYGKTTTLLALSRYLQKEYYVVLMDFQTFGSADFGTEQQFAHSFADAFLRMIRRNINENVKNTEDALNSLKQSMGESRNVFTLRRLFEHLGEICAARINRSFLLLMR